MSDMSGLMKWIIAALAIFIVIGAAYAAVFGQALRQDEDHLATALALPKVVLTSLPGHIGEKYLARDADSFIQAMRREGYEYVEQLGAGHVFKKRNGRYVSTSQMYSRFFMLFTEPKGVGA